MMKNLVFTAVCLAAAASFGARSVAVNVPDERFDSSVGAERLDDDIDRFAYLRVTSTNGWIACAVTAEDAGQRMVLVSVRSGAAKALDANAARIDLVRTVGEGEAAKTETLKSWPVMGSEGDEAWQVICLRAPELKEGMEIRLVPGTENPPRYTDLRRVTFVDSSLMEGGK